ncbi:MAG: cytochrome c peroxidase [Gemmatimonadales bacterium]
MMQTYRKPLMGVLVLLAASCTAAVVADAPEQPVSLGGPTLDLDHPDNYAAPSYPAHYDLRARAGDNTPIDNPVTDRGATLGRVLFFDKNLSLNRGVACASCHAQSAGFSDTKTLSTGFQGGSTARHSMRLANARFYGGGEMFWDRRATDLEDQALHPVVDSVEMGFSAANGGIPALLERLRTTSYYPTLFRWAFGDSLVTEARIRSAIAQYIRSMVSTDSKFDDGLEAVGAYNGPPPVSLPNFTAEENQGLRLFVAPPGQGGAGCAGCHVVPTMALDPQSRSNGLDAGETTIFKAPSLKNVAVTGPYMHDGRFATLEEVIEFYDHGVRPGPALDRRLTNPDGSPRRLGLTPGQKAALVAYLRTLTDQGLLTDRRFATPF